jgi:hypothetical protein
MLTTESQRNGEHKSKSKSEGTEVAENTEVFPSGRKEAPSVEVYIECQTAFGRSKLWSDR